MFLNEIAEKYGSYWDQVKDAHVGNGWISIYKKDWGDVIPAPSKSDLQYGGMFWRLNCFRDLPDLPSTLNNMFND